MTAFVEKRKPNFTDNWGADRQPSVCVLVGNDLPAFNQSDIKKKIVEVQVFFLKNKNKKRKMYACAVFQLFEEVKGWVVFSSVGHLS